MKKLFSTLAMTLAVFASAKAVVVEQLVLKNGTELNGYIQMQKGDNYTFVSDYATIYLKKADIKEIKTATAYGLKDLNEAWIEWATKNDAFEGYGDNRILRLVDIVAKDRYYNKVRILENGEIVKFVEMTPNTYNVSWKNDVEAKKGIKRDKTAISGINVKYTLSNGLDYEGQFAENTGTNMGVYLSNGMIQNFKTLDVIKYNYYAINPHQDLFEQTPLLDIVKTDKGDVRGFIIEENYISKNAKENRLLIQEESGVIQSIPMSDAKEFRKEVNPRYNPQFDVILNEGEFLVNRQPATFINVKKNEQFLVLDDITPNMQLAMDGNHLAKFDVEYMATTGPENIFQLVKLTKMKVKKQTIYCFSFEDLAEHAIMPIKNELPTVNGTKKVTYQIGVEGGYALYDKANKRVIALIVK